MQSTPIHDNCQSTQNRKEFCNLMKSILKKKKPLTNIIMKKECYSLKIVNPWKKFYTQHVYSKLPTSTGSLKRQESSIKTSISALLTMPKPSTMWITINCGKFWKRWEYQTTWPVSWENCMQVRKELLELDLGQQTGSK